MTVEGAVETCTYHELHRRAQLGALALRRLGVRCADCRCRLPSAHKTRPPPPRTLNSVFCIWIPHRPLPFPHHHHPLF